VAGCADGCENENVDSARGVVPGVLGVPMDGAGAGSLALFHETARVS